MNKLLVDTSLYSHAMRGNEPACDLLREADELLVCPVVLGELRSGFSGGREEDKNLRDLDAFIASSRVRLITITPDTAVFYADILARLRRRGTPIPTNDLWIAACAMEQAAAIGTYDGHFAAVEGVLTRIL